MQDKVIEKPVEEQEEVQEEETKRQFIEHKKNKIIIRDPKHSTYGFFNGLAYLVIGLIKVCMSFIALLGVGCLIGIVFGITFLVTLISKGLFFVGVLLLLIGALLINIVLLKIIYDFVFNQKSSFKKIFYVFMGGFVMMGVGLGISFCDYLTFKEIDYIGDIEYATYEKILKYEDEMVIDFLDCDNLEIVYEQRDDIKVEITYNKEGSVYINKYFNSYYDEEASEYGNYLVYTYDYYEYGNDFVDNFNYAIDLIKNKERIGRIDYQEIVKIKMYVREDIYQKLQNNYEKVYN